ncbi:hypothetical protein [Candidatus Palauibacter sp.]|uniref:hypothetical protein n=1 Tax=Candidatus Palauibacter sp. TaxID=3101350 RepID=UPI003CC550ED
MPSVRFARHPAGILGLAAFAAAFAAGCGSTQRNGVYRLAAPYNFAFYDTHEEAARSFYAAHFTHFAAYEMLMSPGEDTPRQMSEFETQVRAYIADPPRFEPPAQIIAPGWTRLAFETAQSMDWTHMLHSQLYDILTDDRIADKRAAGERAIAYYLSEPEAAFSTRGYGHRFMEGGGEWAGNFYAAYPDINGILWAYHWHHAAVYEALMEPDAERRGMELDRVIDVFIDSVLAELPHVMPLTGEVAPRFSRMFPAAAHIFDNLHMMHDVVNDIMADPSYSRPEKAAEIERLRGQMTYAGQDTVEAPGMPMGGDHRMSPHAMRVPTELPTGEWLPQGHPEARMAPMGEFMRPLPAPRRDLPVGARNGGDR